MKSDREYKFTKNIVFHFEEADIVNKIKIAEKCFLPSVGFEPTTSGIRDQRLKPLDHKGL